MGDRPKVSKQCREVFVMSLFVKDRSFLRNLLSSHHVEVDLDEEFNHTSKC